VKILLSNHQDSEAVIVFVPITTVAPAATDCELNDVSKLVSAQLKSPVN
jgi:hypothetical protein